MTSNKWVPACDREKQVMGNKVVPKNDVVLGLRSVALMASLSAEMKLLWHSISDKDSRGLANPALNFIQDWILNLQRQMA